MNTSTSFSPSQSPETPMLAISALEVRYAALRAVQGISFEVGHGEIVVLLGSNGAGKSSLLKAVVGLESTAGGSVSLDGMDLKRLSLHKRARLGIGYLPEDRHKQGLILDWGLWMNVSLPTLGKFRRRLFLDQAEERRVAKDLLERVEVKAPSVYTKASALSGGNQQKVIVAKLLNSELKIIILDEPTKGVDVGAKTAIFDIMTHLAMQGYGIVMVSSEMPEVLGMSDRIVVMREGRVSATLATKDATQEIILAAAMAEVRPA